MILDFRWLGEVRLPVVLAASMLLLEACPPAFGQAPHAEKARTALESAATLIAEDNPDEALRVLDRVEELEPRNPWLWFYRGVANAQLGDPYLAMSCFDQASDILAELGDPDPDLAERISIQRSRARRQVFGFSITTGLAYDSNVGYTGDTGNLGLVTNRPDGRFSSSFRLDFAPVADRHQTLAVGVRVGHSWHFAIEQFDYQDYGGYLSYTRRLGRHWELGLRLDYDYSFLGNEPFLSNFGMTPAVTYKWDAVEGAVSPRTTSIYYQLQYQDYLFDIEPQFDRDGPNNAVGIEQRLAVRPLPDTDWICELTAGYRFESFATQGSEFDRFGHTFELGLDVPLLNPSNPSEYLIWPDKETVFQFRANWLIDHYRKRSLIDDDGRRRKDLITTLGFVLSQTLVNDPNNGDLVLHFIVNWSDADSNVVTSDDLRIYTYDKVVWGIQLAWSF